MVLSSLYVVSFCGTTTNKIIDEYLDTELGIDSIGMGGWEGWSFGVSVFYAGWRGGRRCRDVAMVDKIEATVHVTIKFPSKFGLAQMTYFKLQSRTVKVRLFLRRNIWMATTIQKCI